MKIILVTLLALQFLVISFYGILFFRGSAINHLSEESFTQLHISFQDPPEGDVGVSALISIVDELDVLLTRFVYLDATTVIIYTNDITLGGRVELREGRFPEAGTTEFLSNTYRDDAYQIGLINHVMPGYTVLVMYLEGNHNFDPSGVYELSTIDEATIDAITETIDPYVIASSVWHMQDMETSVLDVIRAQLGSQTQFTEMFIIIGVIFVSTLLTTIKYILSTLKSLSVYLLHGFSMVKLILKSIKNILLFLSVAFIIAIIVTVIYIHGSGYTGLVTPLFQLLFFLFCILNSP